MTVSYLVAFLTARLDEDEIWAREASRFSTSGGDGHTAPELPGGMHWRWGYGDQWAEVVPDMSISPQMNEVPVAGDWCSVTLVSVESSQWDHGNGVVWEMPEQVIDGSEVRTAAAGHIARHDPARVLAEVAAKRAIVTTHANGGEIVPGVRFCTECGSGEPNEYPTRWPCATLRLLASVYADHPDYDPAWKVGP